MKKVIVVGDFLTHLLDEPVAKAFEFFTYNVFRFNSSVYVYPTNILRKIQRGFSNGPNYWILWIRFYQAIKIVRPDIIYLRQPLEYPRWFLKVVKSHFNPKLISYMNDNPFGLYQNKRRWKYFIDTIPLFDLHCIFRESNKKDFIKCGARNIVLFLPFYTQEIHYTKTIAYGYKYDAVFIGHYEPDGRMEYLEKLKNNNFKVGVWGNFDRYKNESKLFPDFPGRTYLNTKQYRETINSSLVSLCFFSKINNDVLTNRVFEIPMCGGLLVAERNDTITQLFRENEEALFFSDFEELEAKIKFIKDNPKMRKKIIMNSQRKIVQGKHEVKDRIKTILHEVNQTNKKM